MNSKKNDIEIIYSRLRKHLPGENGFATNLLMETPEKKYSLVKFILGEGNRRKAMISAGNSWGRNQVVWRQFALSFKTTGFENFADVWELTFLPCLNPYGFEIGSRENYEGKDLNRLFKHDSPPQEVKFAKSIFVSSYDLTIELHEDFMTPGYYLYQMGNSSRR